MEILKGVFVNVLLLSLSGTLLFFAVWAAGRLFHKQVSKAFAYYLWLLVILRLLTPYQPEWGLGQWVLESAALPGEWVSTVFDRETAAPAQSREGWSAASGGIDAGGPEHAVAGLEIEGFTGDAFSESGQYGASGENFRSVWNLVTPRPPADTQGNARTSGTALSFAGDCLAILWLAVTGALLLNNALQYKAFLAVLEGLKEPVEHERTGRLYRQAALAVGVRETKLPRLYQADCISSPLLVGIRKPEIVIPREIIAEARKSGGYDQLLHILSHELTHFQRKDIAYKWLLLLVKTVHWFNPFVYIVAKKAAADCEVSCDEAVCTRLSGEERIGYGNALLKAASLGKSAAVKINEEFCTSMGKDGKEMLNRLKTVKSASRLSWMQKGICAGLAAALCVVGLSVGMVRAGAQEPDEQGFAHRQALNLLASSLVLDEENGLLSFCAPAENMRMYVRGPYVKEGRAYYTEDYLRESDGIGGLTPGTTYTTDMFTLDYFDFEIEFQIFESSDHSQCRSVFLSSEAIATFSAQEQYPDWQTAYTEVIRKLFTHEEYPYAPQTPEELRWYYENREFLDTAPYDIVDLETGFALYDMDENGVPELFVKAGGERAQCYVYTFYNGRAQYMGNTYGAVYAGGTVPKNYRELSANAVFTSENSRFVMDFVLIRESVDLEEGFFQTAEALPFDRVNGERVADLQVMMAIRAILLAEGQLAETDEMLIKEAANWAEAYASRDGSIRYNMLTKEKQDVFFQEDETVVSDEELFWESGFISLRGSSPWVEQYSIGKAGEQEFFVTYFMRTSAPDDYYVMRERIRFGQVDGQWKVQDYETSSQIPLIYYPDLLTLEESVAEGAVRQSRGRNRDVEGNLDGAGVMLLSTETGERGEVTAYAITLTSKFNYADDHMKLTAQPAVEPIIIRLSRPWDDGYMLSVVQTPGSDEDYWAEIFRTFPEEYHETIRNSHPDLCEDEVEYERLQQELWDSLVKSLEKGLSEEHWGFRGVTLSDFRITEGGKVTGGMVVRDENGEVTWLISWPEFVPQAEWPEQMPQ